MCKTGLSPTRFWVLQTVHSAVGTVFSLFLYELVLAMIMRRSFCPCRSELGTEKIALDDISLLTYVDNISISAKQRIQIQLRNIEIV